MGPPSNPAIVFDSPSASAAFGALPLDLGLDPANIAAIVGNLGKSSEDERAKRLDEVVAIISVGARDPRDPGTLSL